MVYLFLFIYFFTTTGSFTFSFRYDHKELITRPDAMCQIPHIAAIKAMPPYPSLGNILLLKMSTNAIPEFCIPVSIVIVFLFINFILNKPEILKPVINAKKL